MRAGLVSLCLWACAWGPAPAKGAAAETAPLPVVAAPQSSNDAAQAPEQAAVDYNADAPPPTSYDQLGSEGRPSLAPESAALVRQLGRVLVALLLTCTLIYLFFRLGLPRVMHLWLKQGEPSYFVRERVALDAANALVRIEHASGQQYLLGVGSAGVQLIERLPPPAGGPLSTPSGRPRSFSAALHDSDSKDEP